MANDASLADLVAGPDDVRVSSPIAYIISILIGLVTAFLVGMLVIARRKAAEAETKAALTEEQMKQAKENIELAKNEETRKAAEAKVGALTADVESNKAAIKELEDRQTELADKLKKVNSWADLQVLPPK